jgi:hypothetical protein
MALTISAFALLAALVVGVIHVVMLQRTGIMISEGRQTVRMLHSYNAALDVWRRMARVPDEDPRAEQLREVRDNRGRTLRGELQELRGQLRSVEDKGLIDVVLSDLTRPDSASDAERAELGEAGVTAINKLIAGQDAALFEVFERNQRSQWFGSVVIALTLVASLLLIAPISWVYLRYKRGVPPAL